MSTADFLGDFAIDSAVGSRQGTLATGPDGRKMLPMSHTPYYYAPGGKYVLFLDLLGVTAFVRSSFQKKAEETDDREKEFELAQKQFEIAQADVDREYRRFHEHLEALLRQHTRTSRCAALCGAGRAAGRSPGAGRRAVTGTTPTTIARSSVAR